MRKYKNQMYERSARQIGAVAFSLCAYIAPAMLGIFALMFIADGATAAVTGHHLIAMFAGHGGVMMAAAAAPAVAQPNPQKDISALLARITRDQGPETEQTLNWANNAPASTPTSLRTDRKIKFFDLHLRGRITVGAGVVTFRAGPTLLGTPLFSLLQQITIRGQHLRYGAQSPVLMRGEAAAEYAALMIPNYQPRFSVSVNGGALTQGGALSGAANATNDFDIVLPIPMFPPDVSGADSVFYCMHGPDWPGNLYMDVQFADPTALGVTLASIANGGTVTAFGSAAGTGTLEINSERPLISKEWMAKIRPSLLFRTSFFQQPTAAVSGSGGSNQKLSDLTVGKDTTRIFLKTGTQLAATTGGIVTFGSLIDTIVTRTVIAMDNRQLRFQGANGDSVMQDYMARAYGRTIPAGYRVIDFISGNGPNPANPKAAFPSSKLTAARKFELDGDITGAANQIAEVTQEMILGRPAILS